MSSYCQSLAMLLLGGAVLLGPPTAHGQQSGDASSASTAREPLSEEVRNQYAHGAQRPGPDDDPEEWERGYQIGVRLGPYRKDINTRSLHNGWYAGRINQEREQEYKKRLAQETAQIHEKLERERQREEERVTRERKAAEEVRWQKKLADDVHNYTARAKEEARLAAEAKRRAPLVQAYGSEEAANQWDRGYKDAEAIPPDVDTPLLYFAYWEGHYAKLQEEAQKTPGTKSPPPPSRDEMTSWWLWDRAESLSKQYVARINAMNLQSTVLLLHAEGGGIDMAKVQSALASSEAAIEATDTALERTRRMLAAYEAFNEQASAATRVQPLLVDVLNKLIEQDLGPGAANVKFAGHRLVLEAKVENIKGFAESLRNHPVSVPVGFEEMGARLREWIPVLEKVRKVDTLRQRLAIENFSAKALAEANREYQDFASNWASSNLREWRRVDLPRIYTDYLAPSPTIGQEAQELAGQDTSPGQSATLVPIADTKADAASGSKVEDQQPDPANAYTTRPATGAKSPAITTRPTNPLAFSFLTVLAITGFLLLAFYSAKAITKRKSAEAR